jgi:hypothetical protein
MLVMLDEAPVRKLLAGSVPRLRRGGLNESVGSQVREFGKEQSEARLRRHFRPRLRSESPGKGWFDGQDGTGAADWHTCLPVSAKAVSWRQDNSHEIS